MSERYKEAHNIQNTVVLNTINSLPNPIVVDFGCGTGSDGHEILSKNEEVKFIGIDSSKYMLRVASDKFLIHKFSKRSLFLNFDFQHLSGKYLFEILKLNNCNQRFNCVISSFVLHHYPIETRLKFYQLVKQIIEVDGVFILTDLFANQIDLCNQIALDKEIVDISASSKRIENEGIKLQTNSTINENHYLIENSPYPLIKEIQLLQSNGFNNQDVIFRSGQIGVLTLKM